MGLAMPQCQCAWEFNPPVAQTPPQRTWVGLTDEEKQEAYYKIDSWRECVAFIEAKLKEKNT
jgi:pyruvate/2-oxoglutarate dehydrogenase complex dihydrolipoamide dehydrogenase (E3) component